MTEPIEKSLDYKTTEFNLSEKINQSFHEYNLGIITNQVLLKNRIKEINKEFIRLLKEDEKMDLEDYQKLRLIQLAGNKLIGEAEEK